MEWSKPVERMREMVLAIRAIWARWHEGTKLDFQGDFYRHTLMTPFFDPGPNPFGVPRIFLGGVGPRMTEVAGEVADGFMIHPFSTEKFMRETTLPALERGLALSGRSRSRPGDRVPVDGDRRGDRRGARQGPRRDAPTPRVLRFDARVQGRARRARLGRDAGRAQPALEDRRLGDDGRDDHRRDRRHVRRVGHPRADRPPPRTSATATSRNASRSTLPPNSAPTAWPASSRVAGRSDRELSGAGSTVFP